MEPIGMEATLITLPHTAHSPWDMFVHLPEEGAICTGDAAAEFQTMYLKCQCGKLDPFVKDS